MLYDSIIIGTGPAGVSAAINLKVLGKNFLWFGSGAVSEKAAAAELVRNYPGLPDITGKQLVWTFENHAKSLGIEAENKLVTAIYDLGGRFAVAAGTDTYESRTIILCTGVAAAKPIAGEEAFLGRGVSYCATCDGMLYRGKPVAVLGYTPTARHEAEFLEGIGCSVTYFERPASCTIRGGSQVEEITCDGKTAAVAGVFILRPTMAPTELFPGLAVENGYVTVDRRMATNLPGVFAAGDCTGGPLQVSKATGEGLVAGQSAAAYAAAIMRKEQAAES